MIKIIKEEKEKNFDKTRYKQNFEDMLNHIESSAYEEDLSEFFRIITFLLDEFDGAEDTAYEYVIDGVKSLLNNIYKYDGEKEKLYNGVMGYNTK